MFDYSTVRNNKPSIIYDEDVRPALDELSRVQEVAEELASSLRMAIFYLDYKEAERLLPEVINAYEIVINAAKAYSHALASKR
jgi:hypothetical protein